MPFFKTFSVLILLFSMGAAAPTLNVRADGQPASPAVQKQNGILAQKINAQFAKIKADDECTDELPMACVDNQFAQCVGGKWASIKCPSQLQCFSLPLVNGAGQAISCVSLTDALERFKASGVTGGPTGGDADQVNSGNGNGVNDDDDVDCDDADDTTPGDDSDLDGDCDDDDSGANTPTPRTVIRATPSLSPSVQPSPATVSPASGGNTYGSGYDGGMYRRQLQIPSSPVFTSPSSAATSTVVASSPTDVVVIPSPSSATTISAIPSVITQTPSASTTPTTISSSGLVTPTVVIGTDGIVTVTIVSTVTVAPTNCALLPVASSSATAIGSAATLVQPLPVSSNVPRVTSIAIASPSASSGGLASSGTVSTASPTISSTITVSTPVVSGFFDLSVLLTANTTPTPAV